MQTFTCEHCGRKFRRGSHYICSGQLVLTVEGTAAAPALAAKIVTHQGK